MEKYIPVVVIKELPKRIKYFQRSKRTALIVPKLHSERHAQGKLLNMPDGNIPIWQ